MSVVSRQMPNWDSLYEIAASQEGLFTSEQAAMAGYSLPLISHHLKGGKMQRVRRGIYRLKHFPSGDHEDLVALWLWSERAGVFSHETALALHELSDVFPSKAHLTLPNSWKRRRLRTPEFLVLHHGDMTDEEKSWMGAVPITAVTRTLNDIARTGGSPELLAQAATQALRRGLATKDDLHEVAYALEAFGGLQS